MSDKYNICFVCGEENQPKQKFCSACGAKINEDGSTKVGSNKEDQTASKKNLYNGPPLSSTSIIYFVFALIIFGGFLLVSSGTFEKPEKSGSFSVPQNNNPHGPDLSSMNKIQELETKVKNNPKDFSTLLKLGHLYSDSGFYNKAIEKYDQYLVKNPNHTDVIVDRGFCYFELKNFEKAKENFLKALELEPTHQIATFNLGIVFFNTGNEQKANEYFAKASDINPNTDIGKKAKEFLKSN